MLLFACALERLSRCKQDGQSPHVLLEGLPWERIACVALPVPTHADESAPPESLLHPAPLPTPCDQGAGEPGAAWDTFISTLPVPVRFVSHPLCHASAAFWATSFERALCLTYDSGMNGGAWFGGLYRASIYEGLTLLDRFATAHYARIGLLYSALTALLGFTPGRHEGKLTGLAAYGLPSARCRALLEHWLIEDHAEIEALLNGSDFDEKRIRLQKRLKGIPKEELAATLQAITEEHIVAILKRAKKRGWTSPNICLSGGLFANVKLNQRVWEEGFEGIFIAPAMTNDGTAHGAALHVLASEGKLKNGRLDSVSAGPAFTGQQIEEALRSAGLRWEKIAKPSEKIAALLANGKTVAVFEGGMEFGPRALGNRSILASASDTAINSKLNARLSRSDFMPFAPMTRLEDAEQCYENISGAEHAAAFMTMTFACTPFMKERCPAVVHVDGTARPQLVAKDKQPFIHAVLSAYKDATGNPALVNTSFNLHEEPIVCSPAEAIESFLKAGLDYLYFDPEILVSFKGQKLH
jgi:carbamoyltransferase